MDGLLPATVIGGTERPSPFLEPITQDNITREDVAWLVKATQTGYNDTTAPAVVALAMAGKCMIWRLCAPLEGVAVTIVRRASQGSALWIEYLAGEGIVENKELCQLAFRDLAKALNCYGVYAIIWNRRLVDAILALPEVNAVGIVLHLEA